MDLSQTPEQEAFRDTVRAFCDRQITADDVRECDREHRPPTDAFKAMAEQGWLGLNIPEAHGGSGAGATEVAILLEEVGSTSSESRRFYARRHRATLVRGAYGRKTVGP